MFSRSAFRSVRVPPLPEGFPNSDAARGKDPNQAQDVGVIAARGERSTDMVQKSALEEATEFPRDKLCIGWGERVWDDLSEVTIYPMIGITRSDEAIIVRVKDLLGPGLSGQDVALGAPFVPRQDDGFEIVDDESLCGILVTTEGGRGKIRVGDLANLKSQREKHFVGCGEFDTATKKLWGPHVMIVKRGQSAVVEGRPTLRLFVRMAPGTAQGAARLLTEHVWLFRQTVSSEKAPVWHEDIIKKQRSVSPSIEK